MRAETMKYESVVTIYRFDKIIHIFLKEESELTLDNITDVVITKCRSKEEYEKDNDWLRANGFNVES